MAQFPTPFGGSLDIWAITVEERAKHDQQFHSLKPISGFITGDQARNFFFQSGLPQPVLAQIWALADMNNDGRMDQVEFSIAMKLIKLKLQGYQLPSTLPPVMKQQPVAISSAPAFGDVIPFDCCMHGKGQWAGWGRRRNPALRECTSVGLQLFGADCL